AGGEELNRGAAARLCQRLAQRLGSESAERLRTARWRLASNAGTLRVPERRRRGHVARRRDPPGAPASRVGRMLFLGAVKWLPETKAFDEAFARDGGARSHYRPLVSILESFTQSEIERRERF